jgi:MFS family permease
MRRPLVVAAGAFVCFGMFWGSWAVSTSDVERYTGLSNAGLGLLLSISIGFGGLSAAAAGGITARVGAERILPLVLIPWGTFSIVAGVAPDKIAFVCTFAFAVASAGIVDMAMNTVATVGLGGSPSGMVRFHALFNAGTLCGAGLVAGLVSGAISWRWTWVVTGFGALLLALVARRSDVHETVPAVAALLEPPAVPSVPAKGSESLLRSFSAIGRQGLVAMAVTFAITAVVEGGIDTWGVLYLRTRIATGVIVGAGAYAAGQSIAAATRASGSTFVNRLGDKRGLILGSGLACLGLALEASTTNAALSACSLAAAAGGVSLCWPLMMARLASVGEVRASYAADQGPSAGDRIADASSDSQVGTAALVGGFTAAGYMGWVLGPAVIGTLSDQAGLRAGLLLLAGLSAVACVSLAAANPRPVAR